MTKIGEGGGILASSSCGASTTQESGVASSCPVAVTARLGQRSEMQLVWLTVCGVFFFDSQTGREGHRHLATLATVAPGVSLQVQRGNFDLVGTAGGLTSAFCAR